MNNHGIVRAKPFVILLAVGFSVIIGFAFFHTGSGNAISLSGFVSTNGVSKIPYRINATRTYYSSSLFKRFGGRTDGKNNSEYWTVSLSIKGKPLKMTESAFYDLHAIRSIEPLKFENGKYVMVIHGNNLLEPVAVEYVFDSQEMRAERIVILTGNSKSIVRRKTVLYPVYTFTQAGSSGASGVRMVARDGKLYCESAATKPVR